MAYHQSHSHCAVTFARGSTLDGASAGYQAVIAVSLPYQFLFDPKVTAKKAYLQQFKTAAFDFYTQEAVNAIAAPFVKTSCLDHMSVLRGRIFIALDSRIHRYVRFLPTSLSQVQLYFLE